MRKSFVSFLFLGLVCTSIFSTTALDLALDGAQLIDKSKMAWFPFNMLYFYTGLLELSKAVSLEPYNTDIRMLRVSVLFDYIDYGFIAEMLKSDLEYLLLVRESWDEKLSKKEALIYYMLCNVYASLKDEKMLHLCFEKLSKLEEGGKYIQKLREKFPSFFERARGP